MIVALLAGVAGVLSLTTAKSGALIGVLISVTTIPAAANVGVAAAYGDWSEFSGALVQLLINLGSIVVAGTTTTLCCSAPCTHAGSGLEPVAHPRLRDEVAGPGRIGLELLRIWAM